MEGSVCVVIDLHDRTRVVYVPFTSAKANYNSICVKEIGATNLQNEINNRLVLRRNQFTHGEQGSYSNFIFGRGPQIQ
jgi:hypothetical protein